MQYLGCTRTGTTTMSWPLAYGVRAGVQALLLGLTGGGRQVVTQEPCVRHMGVGAGNVQLHHIGPNAP